MSHVHEKVVEERESSSTAIMAILVVLVLAILIWAIFFSGWIVDRDNTDVRETNVDQDNTDVDVNQPSDGGGNQPSPSPGGTSSP